MKKSFNVSFISSYLPRRCGIATFTNDLVTSFREIDSEITPNGSVTALNDIPEGYKYGKEVKFEIRDKNINDYKEAAYFLNLSDNNVMNLQHEYGLYGGEAGSHILNLLENLKKPVVTTLHTVLSKPNDDQLKVVQELGKLSSYLIVQSNKAMNILTGAYNILPQKIVTIPHGAHDVPFLDTAYYKDKFKLEGRKVILTFGLLGPGKGIEDVINALSNIVKTNPDITYIILGATHPHVKRHSGESYRLTLENLVKRNNLENNVLFINRFVNTDELLEFILMSDIYIAPYHNLQQITSGTLSYAVASGKAVISTNFWHAEELLAEERGIIYPAGDIEALEKSIKELLDDDIKRNKLRRNAYDAGRMFTWEKIAGEYYNLFQKASNQYSFITNSLTQQKYKLMPSLPEVNLKHLKNLTDTTGMLQHSIFSVPNRNEGYCVDDNCRALLVAIMNKYLFQDEISEALIPTYLAFIFHAYNKKTGLFSNFMSYDRKWLDESGSEDSNGRTVFVLGYMIKNTEDYSHLGLCKYLFDSTIKNMKRFTSLRAISHIIMGSIFYLYKFSGARDVKNISQKLLEKLHEAYLENSNDNWKWFEKKMTYDNARLPQALLMGGLYFKNSNYLYSGLESLTWMFDVLYDKNKNHISLIGNDGWLQENRKKAKFDQQSIEIPSIIDACYQAYLVTEDHEWINKISLAFSWFLGNNDRQESLIDFVTGGCYDGLSSGSMNQNQGAESTLSWLLSLHRMYRIRQELQVE
jgi:glycosyltransferase involved in cell wall biosynthesis